MNQNQVEGEIKKIIFKHFPPKKYQIFLFGSRATDTNRHFSDYDIGIMGETPLSSSQLSQVKEELEESQLPIVVDVVDLKTVDPEFKQIAMRKAKLWTN